MSKNNLKNNNPFSKKKRQIKGLEYVGMATQMAVIILVFSYGGLWLDSYLSTKDIFLIIGALLGVAIALYSFIRLVIRDEAKSKQD